SPVTLVVFLSLQPALTIRTAATNEIHFIAFLLLTVGFPSSSQSLRCDPTLTPRLLTEQAPYQKWKKPDSQRRRHFDASNENSPAHPHAPGCSSVSSACRYDSRRKRTPE